MSIRDRARRRIKELLNRSSSKKEASTERSKDPSHLQAATNSIVAPSHPSEIYPATEKAKVDDTEHVTDLPVQTAFQVSSTQSTELESDYLSDDAPVRLAHHAPVTQKGSNEYTVQINNPDESTLNFNVREDEFILDAADRSGLELPYSCRSGGCLSCAARVISGNVQQAEQYVLEDEHLEQGFVLLCCCTITSDAIFIGYQEDMID